jgi:hypothetical protein
MDHEDTEWKDMDGLIWPVNKHSGWNFLDN